MGKKTATYYIPNGGEGGIWNAPGGKVNIDVQPKAFAIEY